ncbi:hypothetical protein GCM10027447_18550 [Glycomyces halotolerans]
MQAKPRAFILAGAFRVVCRNPRYLVELAERDLSILIITPEETRAQAEAAFQSADPAFTLITEIAYVDGSLDRESSFNAGAVAAAEDWSRRYDIVGAYAMEEMLVEPAGIICDRFGLPSPGLRASRACRSKYLQRFYLGTFSPESRTLPPGERGDNAPRFPVVAKPAGRHASSGVVRCRDAAELAAALADYPEHETVLVEQQVTGREYSVESLVQDGEVLFDSVTAKRTNEDLGRTFVELAHTVPGRVESPGTTAAVTEANRRTLAALAYRDGITHSEWRVDQSGNPVLMEVASRTPGDGITLLYRLACGEALESQIIKIALGERAGYPRPRRVARQVYLEHRPGVLQDVVVDWPGIHPTWLGESELWPQMRPGEAGDGPALKAVLVLKSKGSPLAELRSSDDRAVTFFIDADTESELDAIERRVRAAITVVTSDFEERPC